jgi:integrase
MSQGVSNIVRLAALTGQRRAEIAGLRHADIEWKVNAPCLTITSGRAKNRNQHRVPLSRQAYEVCALRRQLRQTASTCFRGLMARVSTRAASAKPWRGQGYC